MNRPTNQSATGIEADVLDDLVVLKSNALPAVDGTAPHHKQGDSSGKPGSALQQMAQDFRLCACFLDRAYSSVEDVSGR